MAANGLSFFPPPPAAAAAADDDDDTNDGGGTDGGRVAAARGACSMTTAVSPYRGTPVNDTPSDEGSVMLLSCRSDPRRSLELRAMTSISSLMKLEGSFCFIHSAACII